MAFYDSLKSKEIELKNKKINIYVCGPTVYDLIHIGNARPLILADLLIRYLRISNIEYNYLLNLTDIDDKIIAKASEQNKTEEEISSLYIEEFIRDCSDLNLIKPSKIVKVTDNIDNIINFTNELIKQKMAYISEGNVFFDIKKLLNQYGLLSRQDLNKLVLGEKNDENYLKKTDLDFAVWKKTAKGISYDNPFGAQGRPGWHTECAYFNSSYFNNKTIDFHIGGIDLKFPHHENERIMFYAIAKKELANIWMYNGHINIDSQKMSKSLNNVITVREFNQKYTQNTLRYIFYNTNYKKPININDELIKTSLRWNYRNLNFIRTINWQLKLNKVIFFEECVKENYLQAVLNHLKNDLNSSMVITEIDEVFKILSIQMKSKKINKTLYDLFLNLLNNLGFSYIIKELDDNSVSELERWNQAVIDKDFELADKIREKLKEDGIF